MQKNALAFGLALAAIILPSIAFHEDASADVSDRLSTLTKLRAGVQHARGANAYVALRRVWGEWDHGDPTAVEEILHDSANDASLAAPTRAYAGLLEAYARRRRGDLDGARTRVAKLGYVSGWVAVGPFDNEGKSGLDRAFGPEEDMAEPISLGRTYDGKERPVRWRAPPDVSPYGWVDVGAWVRPDQKMCAYASTFVREKRPKQAARPISLWTGASGAMKIFWNGKEVLKDDKYRNFDVDRTAASVVMREGWNRVLVKVCNDEEAPMFTLRLADANGAPDANIETSADLSHASEAAAQRFKKGETPIVAGHVEGPLAAFERQIKGEDAGALEDYARYLVMTQSDDPAEHRARDLARRSAEKAPTIARALLAGDLAENRNQRGVWIDKAEDIVRQNKGVTDDDRIRVLLARATHARGGANWRDAIPYYEKVLAIDPDNVTATLAKVELYGEAGLHDTAMALLEQALRRRPQSVALLRAYASALSDLDRATEAEEVRERYAALRFDDPVFIRDQIDLALARRDTVSAPRWIDRLIAANPDASSVYAQAAQSFVSLGDRPRAIAMFKKALDLAPEDTDSMRALANVYAVGGQTDEQLKLLRRILELIPQDKDTREYVAHTEPSKPRPDEAYARPSTEFLPLGKAPAAGHDRRTLVDLQVTTVFPNGLASRFHQVVFQPLTDSSAASGREYAFGFEADSESVQLRGARVYRKNGNVDEAIETGDGPADNPSIATYTSQRVFYVHFPRLDPGDVVELLYRVEDVAPRNAFADYFGEVNYMQSSEPVARAEYVLIAPKSRTLYFNRPNVPGLTQTQEDKGDSRTYHFVAQNVPAIEPEALAPPYNETLGHVHVSTYKSWDDLATWYWGLVKDQFTADDEVRRRVADVTKGLTDPKAKMRAIYDYVVEKTRYVALEFGIHGFKPYRCAQIFARGFGDCKDKATLIVTMLKEAGIPATIVIVRTGLRGDFETEPASFAPFDHAIAYVPQFDTYLDGTAEYTGSNELPSMDRGSLALQVNEGKPKLVHMPDPPANESLTSRKFDATIGTDGSAQIDWSTSVLGVSAGSWRARYHAESTRKQRMQEDLAGELPGLELTDAGTNDLENIELPAEVHAKGKAPNVARADGDNFSIAMGPREFMVREYAQLSQRKQDIRISAQSTQETEWRVKLPAGVKVTTVPQAAQGTSPYGTFKVDVENANGTVRVKTSIAMTKTRIPVAEYAAFRAYCELVDRALGQRLVFKK